MSIAARSKMPPGSWTRMTRAMAHAISSSALTPADRLRFLLDASERRGVNIAWGGRGSRGGITALAG